MIRTLEELRNFENLCLNLNTQIINKNGNQLTDIELAQIMDIYFSNQLEWLDRMTKQNYTFSLFKIDDRIVGVSGIDHDDLQIRDNSVHIEFQNMGIYQRLMKHTSDWLKRNKQGIAYYLFIEKIDNNRETILNHINLGFVLLDRSTQSEPTYTSDINRKTYTSLGGKDYLVFRTPGHHNINFLKYSARGGRCSGIYIGNGIILTADHCDRYDLPDFNSARIDVNQLIFPFFKPRTVPNYFNVRSQFFRYPNRTSSGENITNDFAIIKLSNVEANKFNKDMEVIPLLQDNLTIHGEVLSPDNIDSQSQNLNYSTYGINSDNIRTTKINHFDNRKIKRYYDRHATKPTLPENMIGDSFPNTLNNFRKKINCVKVVDGDVQLEPGDSGGPHYHIKESTGQIFYIGPTGLRNYSYCQDEFLNTTVPSVYQHKHFIKSHYPGDLLIYNFASDTFLFE